MDTRFKNKQTKKSPSRRPRPIDRNSLLQRSHVDRAKQTSTIRTILYSDTLQPKITVGLPKDVYEREADAVAAKVAKGEKAPAVSRLPASAVFKSVEQNDEDTNDRIQNAAKPDTEDELPQRESEQDEDERVQKAPDEEDEETVQRAAENEEEETTTGTTVQRLEQETDQEEKPVQEKSVRRQRDRMSREQAQEVSRILHAGLSGETILPSTRRVLESRMGVDLSHVRVHNDTASHRAAAFLNARAFTHGHHIWLGQGASQHDIPLMAHEATHVVQQEGAPSIFFSRIEPVGSTSDSVTDEEESPGMLDRLGDLLSPGVDVLLSLLATRAPVVAEVLREIRQKGVLEFLKEKLSEVVIDTFSHLRADNDSVDALFQTFENLAAEAVSILQHLAKGDCGPLRLAINGLKETVTRLAGDAWKGIKAFFEPVGKFFTDIWKSFGAPFIDWIKKAAGSVWTGIQRIGRHIWAALAPLRTTFARAWEEIKRLIGIGADEGDDEGGLIHWLQEKAAEAWTEIVETLQPVIAPIRQLAVSVTALMPLTQISRLRDSVVKWTTDITKMTQAMNQDGVAQNQVSLREEILPAVLDTAQGMRRHIIGTGQWISERIGAIGEQIQAMIGAIQTTPLLAPISGLLQWLPEKASGLVAWTQTTVVDLCTTLGDGLVYLSTFIEPVLDTLTQVASVIGDLAGSLSSFILGATWRRIPKCVRDPIKKFLIETILSNIPIFGQLVKTPKIWARIEAVAMRILQQVFVSGDLAGAAWTLFREVLGLLNIPPGLVVGIIAKASTALGDILRDPLGFLKNLVKGLVAGIRRFCSNIGKHLLTGISGWIFGQLQQAGIQPPQSFSFGAIFGFVMQILDITQERIFRRMVLHPRIGPERVALLRSIVDRLSGVWQWVSVLVREGPAGLWRMLQERLSNLWTKVTSAIIGWISQQVVSRAMMRLATMADPTGIGAVVNIALTIYQAIETAAQYARQILEAVNRFLDGINGIARGAFDIAAGFLENALARLLPAAIGFIANWVGLGNLGHRIREMVERIRLRVDRAIDWLIERGIRTIDAIIRRIRQGVQNIRNWWQRRYQFKTNGESHAIFFENGRLMVNSQKRTLDDLLRELKRLQKEKKSTSKGDEGNVARLYGEAVTLKNQVVDAQRKASSNRRHQGNASASATAEEASMKNLVAKVKILMESLLQLSDNPRTLVNYSGGLQYGQLGKIAAANPLSIPGDSGSSPGDAPMSTTVWQTINQRRSGGGSYWVLGHLINQELHGPGTDKKNITPISRSANAKHHSDAETPVKNHVWNRNSVNPSGNVLTYIVTANYGSENTSIANHLKNGINASSLYMDSGQRQKARETLEQEAKLATNLKCEAWMNNRNRSGKWEKGKKQLPGFPKDVPNRVPNELPRFSDTPPKMRVNLSRDTASKIADNTDLSLSEAEAVVLLRTDHDGRFTNYDQLLEAGISANTIAILRHRSRNVTLRSK